MHLIIIIIIDVIDQEPFFSLYFFAHNNIF